jgi:hypothetical protein
MNPVDIQSSMQVNQMRERYNSMKTSPKMPRVVNTDDPVKNDGKPRLPNERDTAPDVQSLEPRQKIKQAHDDIEHGLVDTDLRGERGLEADRKDISLPHGSKKMQNRT